MLPAGFIMKDRKGEVDQKSRDLKWWPFDVKVRKKPKNLKRIRKKKRKSRKGDRKRKR